MVVHNADHDAAVYSFSLNALLQVSMDGIGEILSSTREGNTDNRIVMQMTRTAVIIVCILTNLLEATSPTATNSSCLSDYSLWIWLWPTPLA